ncbi:MAG TPA: glycine zipper family protein [Acetobacteraceae bacterium]|jgi:hypothetical protein
MRRAPVFIGLASTLALSACVVPPPPGPSVMAMPGQGKTFEVFQQDDGYCRQAATAQTGGASPAVAANNSAVGSAVAGTALGAAAGAAIGAAAGGGPGAGAGAAIGAASGLLLGSSAGVGAAQVSAAGVQQRYDMVYAQCMASKGDTVQGPPSGYAAGYAPGYAYPAGYAYPPPYYGYGYGYGPYISPEIAIGVGGGWGGWGGWRGGWGGWHGGRGGGWHH